MLIVTRRIGESIIIGDNEIEIRVFNIGNGQVRIGVQAPDHIAVNREEVYLRIKAEESQAN